MEYNREISNLTFVVKQYDDDEERPTHDDDAYSPSIVIDYDCRETTSYNFLPFYRRRRYQTLEPDIRRSLKRREYLDLSESSLIWYIIIVCNLLELDIRPQYRDHIANVVLAEVRTALGCDSNTVGHKRNRICVEISAINELVCDERRLVMQRSMDDSCVMVPASKASVHDLKKVEFRDEDREGCENNTSCVICLEELIAGTEVMCMPCSHMFHEECITNWLGTGHHCPLCRFEMPMKEDDDEDTGD